MKELSTEGLGTVVAARVTPFFSEILKEHSGNIHSIHIVGSAVTPDFREKASVIHSVIVLHKMDFGFIRFIASLGKRYKRKGIAAPLIMTPEYLQNSLDVFPVELHDFRLIHKTVAGEDIFSGITIDKEHLRLQCEREVKSRLIGLRQGYLSTLGETDRLTAILSQSILGCMPLLRAIISLLGSPPPVKRHEAVRTLQEMISMDAGIFESLLLLRTGAIKPSKEEVHRFFERYYAVLEKVGKVVDEIRQ